MFSGSGHFIHPDRFCTSNKEKEQELAGAIAVCSQLLGSEGLDDLQSLNNNNPNY